MSHEGELVPLNYLKDMQEALDGPGHSMSSLGSHFVNDKGEADDAKYSRSEAVTLDDQNGGVHGFQRGPFSPPPVRRSFIPTVLVLTSTALLPAAMGALFYVSIGFNAPNGVYFSNGTFVRPIEEGLALGGEGSTLTGLTAHMSPLLVSSVASSLIGFISALVVTLAAFHLGRTWLKASESREPTHLPTPFQYHLILDLVNNASPFALLRFFSYFILRSPQSSGRGFRLWPRRSSPGSSRSPIPSLLALAVLAVAITLSFNWAIKVADIVLHDQITSTLLSVQDRSISFAADAKIQSQCIDITINDCGVINRTHVASIGGLNQSDSMRVYQAANNTGHGALSYLGPPDAGGADGVAATAHTFVAATQCQLYHPECFVQDETIRVCGPHNNSEVEIGSWNQLMFGNGFNVTGWEMRLQSYLTVKGNTSEWHQTALYPTPHPLSNGAAMNPFTTATFGCFDDYANIPYNDSDYTFRTPFINWWTYGSGISNTPWPLCSISVCNTTVYDANYTISGGQLTLDTNSLTEANLSAALAVSGAGMYMGTDDSLYYKWGSRFLDDQLQLDLSAAGNTFGNSTEDFGLAWAQALSNRYLGWTVGVIYLDQIPANASSSRLAISIPLVPAHIFAGLHFLYALAIVALGTSCLMLPKSSGPTGELVVTKRGNGFNGAAEEPVPVLASDVGLAQLRLSDTSLLVHELVVREGQARAEAEAAAARAEALRRSVDGPPMLRKQGSSLKLGEGEGRDENGDVRVALGRGFDGVLGLSFRSQP